MKKHIVIKEGLKNGRNNRKIPILLYHSISYDGNLGFKKYTISPELFSAHMSYLATHQYTTVTVTQFVKAVTGRDGALPNRPVILTFDDGYYDFYTNAFPILKQHGFTATLYIPTAFVGSTTLWLRREGETKRPMLSWEQLAEISLSGIECGAHSHTHHPLDTLSLLVAQDEIVRCKRILEERLAQEVSSLAYPFGYYTTAVRRIVQEAGYSSACAIKYAMSSTVDNPFALSRLMITPDTDVDDLAELITGSSVSLAMLFNSLRSSIWRFLRRCSAWSKHSL